MENTTQKHLSLEDRNYIKQALNQSMTFKEIAKFLSKDPTTIAKEIKKHRTRKEPSRFNGCGTICNNRYACRKKMYVEEIAIIYVSNVQDAIIIAQTFKKTSVFL